MAFTKITKDMNIIAALADEPNDVGGLSAAQLKGKFDEGGLALKTFVNGTLIDELEAGTAAASIGAKDANGHKTNVQGELDNIRESIVAGTVPDGGITTAKLHDGAVTNDKLADPAPTLVGSLLRSLRTNLGDKWALCNGDWYDPEDYPELWAIISTRDYPADNPEYALPADLPSGLLTNGYANGIWGLYNGQLAAEASTKNIAVIIDGKGRGIYTVQPKNSEWSSGGLVGVENDGTQYVVFVLVSNNTLKIYTTADFSSYTIRQSHTLTQVSSSFPDSHVSAAYFDGTYYYLHRTGNNSNQFITVLDTSFNIVREVAVSLYTYRIVPVENRVYGVTWTSGQNSDYAIGVKVLNGDAPTTISGYRTIDVSGNSFSYKMLPVNDDYDVFLYHNSPILVPRDETLPLQTISIPDSPTITAMFVSGDGTKLLAWSSTDCYSCPIDADPTQAASWTKTTISGAVWTNWTNSYVYSYRFKSVALPAKKQIVRAPLIPTIAESSCYNYIKVKE